MIEKFDNMGLYKGDRLLEALDLEFPVHPVEKSLQASVDPNPIAPVLCAHRSTSSRSSLLPSLSLLIEVAAR